MVTLVAAVYVLNGCKQGTRKFIQAHITELKNNLIVFIYKHRPPLNYKVLHYDLLNLNISFKRKAGF